MTNTDLSDGETKKPPAITPEAVDNEDLRQEKSMSEELAVVNDGNNAGALVPMKVSELIRQVSLVQEVMKTVMIPEVHYGKTPGCGDRLSLFKAGAEKLGFVFRLASEFIVDERNLDGGHREYRVTCRLSTIGSGVFNGSGMGVCSTQEAKYRFRTGPKSPTGRAVPKDYWDLKNTNPMKAQEAIGGRGFVAAKNDQGVWEVHQQGEKVEHDNPADYFNTVLKMAKKRAQVDAVLTVTAASDIFSQDLEELEEMERIRSAMKPEFSSEPGSKPPQTAPRGTQSQQTTANGTESQKAAPSTARPQRHSQPPARGDWRTFIVPKFVKKWQGRPLGELDPTDLAWWGKNYEPKGFGGRPPSESDYAFRAALDAAIAEMQGNAGEAAEKIRENIDQSERKEPAPAGKQGELNDEDVSF